MNIQLSSLNLSQHSLWLSSSANGPSLLFRSAAQPAVSPYIQGLREVTERIDRGEPAQMGGLAPLVEAAQQRRAPQESIKTWAKRMAASLAGR